MKSRAQAIIEYALILGIVAAALAAMQLYFRRGIHAAIKLTADEIGSQEDAQEIDPQKGAKTASRITQVTTGPGGVGYEHNRITEGRRRYDFDKTVETTGRASYILEKERE